MRRLRLGIEALRIALGALRARKTRGILTTLGIVIGITGVSATLTTANGLNNSFRESVGALGTDVLYVSRMPWVVRGRFFQFRNRPRIELKDARRLERVLPGALAVNPTIHTERHVKYRSDVVRNVDIIGTTDKHMLVSSAVPELGRFLTAFDVQYRKPVCVVGAALRDGLFDGVDPLNKTIKIGRHSLRVIGVMERQGSGQLFGGPDLDSQIFVPVTTFIRNYGGRHADFNIAVKAPAMTLGALEDFELEVVGEMRKLRKLTPTEADDFAINKLDTLVGMFNETMGKVLLIGMVITGMALLVGGIGVANIMFVSVTERTREIGVRKALGAPRRVILAQFLFESCLIGISGGLAGLAAAFGVTAIINQLVLPASLSLPIVVVAIAVSILVGVVSGLVPAYRASRLDPVEALRYE